MDVSWKSVAGGVICSLFLPALLAASMASAGAAGARDGDRSNPIGAVESMTERRATGWVAAEGRVRVEVVVEGVIVHRSRAGRVRHDVTSVYGLESPARAFAVRTPTVAMRSFCLQAVAGAQRTGLACSVADPADMIAAVGVPRRVLGEAGPIVGYSVEVEGRTGLIPEEVAREVDRVLGDPRSWIAEGARRFKRSAPAQAQVRILVATPATVDRLCAPLATGGYLSCRQGDRVIMNVDRWNEAVPFWTAGIDEYRAYLVNHEVGHYLGRGHQSCTTPGAPAPVMQQQTKGLQGCRPNGWPYPRAR